MNEWSAIAAMQRRQLHSHFYNDIHTLCPSWTCMFKIQIHVDIINACSYTSCLKYIKEITMTASAQSFSCCRTRMIRILLSEKASVLCACTN